MKKKILVLVGLVTACCAAVVGGTGLSEKKVAVMKRGEVFKVVYVGPESPVRITILDPEGQKVFEEKLISHGGFIRPYNFSQLPWGDYKISVADNSGEVLETVHMGDRTDDYWDARATRLEGPEERYMLTIPHREDCEVKIFVYDKYQRLIYSELQSIRHDFARIYNLKNLQGAALTVVNAQTGEEKTFTID